MDKYVVIPCIDIVLFSYDGENKLNNEDFDVKQESTFSLCEDDFLRSLLLQALLAWCSKRPAKNLTEDLPNHIVAQGDLTMQALAMLDNTKGTLVSKAGT